MKRNLMNTIQMIMVLYTELQHIKYNLVILFGGIYKTCKKQVMIGPLIVKQLKDCPKKTTQEKTINGEGVNTVKAPEVGGSSELQKFVKME